METTLVRRQEVLTQVATLQRQLTDFAMNILEPYSITKVQISILLELGFSGALKVSDLGRNMGMSNSNVSAICKRLEKDGMVTRIRNLDDQRVVKIHLTPYAKDCLSEIQQTMADQWFNRMERLSDDEQEIILGSLKLAIDLWA
ncbi:MAG: MarR family transcriptional regulator, partial [Oscillospiraceae bacterium]